MTASFDAIVIGTGQSGPALAHRLAKAGRRVAIVERKRFGGTCVNTGCIPTKSLIASARAAHVARRAADFGVIVEGEVRVDISGLPDGYTASTPIVIEAGHLEAKGTLFAAMDCTAPSAEQIAKIKITATASPEGRESRKDVKPFAMLGVAARPRTIVWLEPDLETLGDAATADPRKAKAEGSAQGDGRLITVKPGGRVSALLKIKRFDHNDRVTFDVDNLPFGVIVDDIGLNGILIPEGATERRVFLTSAAWTPEAVRPCFARIRENPNPTSAPVLLRVPKR